MASMNDLVTKALQDVQRGRISVIVFVPIDAQGAQAGVCDFDPLVLLLPDGFARVGLGVVQAIELLKKQGETKAIENMKRIITPNGN